MCIYPEQILHQDSSIIAINKPSGLLTIPDGYNPELSNLKSELDNIYGKVWVVHRLDKETSGVIIFAKTKIAHRILNNQFANRLISKKYIALAHNIPDWKEYNLILSIKINGDRKHRTIPNESGKKSISNFRILENLVFHNLSKIEIIPHTGYTHQIRCHLSHLGFPLVGDFLYTKNISELQKSINEKFKRIMLHASLISFYHPEGNNKIEIFSPEPPLFNLTKKGINE